MKESMTFDKIDGIDIDYQLALFIKNIHNLQTTNPELSPLFSQIVEKLFYYNLKGKVNRFGIEYTLERVIDGDF